VRARPVVGRDITEARAIGLYQADVNENDAGRR